MIVPTVVLALSAVVVLVGGIAELVDTVRASRAPALPSGAEVTPERPDVADVGRWPMLAWVGLSAFTVLVPVSVLDRQPAVEDPAFLILLLGFAGDRAFYLVRRRRSGERGALVAETLVLVVGALGFLVGFTI